MFCATGNHLAGTPTTISENQAAVDWFYAKLPGRNGSPKAGDSTGDTVPDADQDELALNQA
jgi:hypothetical protein